MGDNCRPASAGAADEHRAGHGSAKARTYAFLAAGSMDRHAIVSQRFLLRCVSQDLALFCRTGDRAGQAGNGVTFRRTEGLGASGKDDPNSPCCNSAAPSPSTSQLSGFIPDRVTM
jgi:hypothetical protein